MSRLVARLLLSMLLFPLASLVYLIAMFMYYRMARPRGPQSEDQMFIVGGLAAWVFMGMYWFLLWRGSVRFTGERVVFTTISVMAAIVLSMIGGAFMNTVERGLGSFIGSAAAPLLWLVGTIFIWRESPRERMERLRSVSTGGIICPTCGYNLTGLNSTRCPECGAQFTLDELLASQPAHAGEELVQ